MQKASPWTTDPGASPLNPQTRTAVSSMRTFCLELLQLITSCPEVKVTDLSYGWQGIVGQVHYAKDGRLYEVCIRPLKKPFAECGCDRGVIRGGNAAHTCVECDYNQRQRIRP
jgi:hypothetical protein